MKTFSKILPFFLFTFAPVLVRGALDAESTWVASTEVDELVRRHTVRFVRSEKNGFVPFCSGVVFGPSEVLSAGHCADSKASSEAFKRGQVFVEIYDPKAKDKISRIQVQSKESKDGEGTDLSLLRLTLDSPVKASLPLAYGGCDADSEFVTAGFGRNEKGKSPQYAAYSRYRQVTEKEIDDMEKTKTFKREPEVDKKQLFLRPQAGSVCVGDSGGPIFCRSKGKWAIAGIISNVAVTRANLQPRSYSPEEYCKYTDLLSASRVDQNMRLIETWRSGAQTGGKSSATVK